MDITTDFGSVVLGSSPGGSTKIIMQFSLWLAPLIGLLLFETLADYFSGRWATSEQLGWAFAASAIYMGSTLCWLVAMKHGVGLARGTIIISILSALLTVLMGVLIFHERLTPTQLIGSLLGAAGFILIMLDA